MKTQTTISEACKYKNDNPNSVIIFDGDIGTILTDDDIQECTGKKSRNISVQEFRDRFTIAETDLFITKTFSDNNVAKLQFKLSTAQEPLDLDGVQLNDGMLYLVAVGVITESRRIEILS